MRGGVWDGNFWGRASITIRLGGLRVAISLSTIGSSQKIAVLKKIMDSNVHVPKTFTVPKLSCSPGFCALQNSCSPKKLKNLLRDLIHAVVDRGEGGSVLAFLGVTRWVPQYFESKVAPILISLLLDGNWTVDQILGFISGFKPCCFEWVFLR